MAPFRVFTSQVFVKNETGYTDPPLPTDAVAVFNVGYEPDVQITEREDVQGTLMKFTGIPGARMGRVTFSTYLKGSGADDPTTAPEQGTSLKGCRLNEAASGVPVDTHTYKPLVAETTETAVSFYNDGIRYAISNAIGDVEIVGERGAPLRADFTYTGVLQIPADKALIGAVTYDATIPPALINTPITILGVTTGICRSIRFALGQNVTMRDSIAAADGYAGAFQSDRRSTGSFEIEAPTVAAHDLQTKWQDGTTGVIKTDPVGGTVGNKVQIIANVASLTSLSYSESDGRSMVTGEFLCGRTGATAEGDDLQIIYT